MSQRPNVISMPRRAIAEALMRMIAAYQAVDDRDWHEHARKLIEQGTRREGRT